jgi:P-type E1-E2 ATPase
MDRAARAGIVVKGGDALERLARVGAVAFDKTGTLTEGRPKVVRVERATGSPWDEQQLLGLAAAIEAGSVHVLATAIVDGARERGAAVPGDVDAAEEIGSGFRAKWESRDVLLGKPAFVAGQSHGRLERSALGPGEVAVDLAIDGALAGRIVLRDDLRADASATVADLGALGVRRVVMVTGDGELNARRVAADAGIAEVWADLHPAQKVEVLAEVPHSIMVGDGVNDAPVLAAADVGIAMGGRGASAASETADVVLLADELRLVPEAVRIARRTLGVARQSVVVGVGLSVVLMLIAATGVIPAAAGALAQEAVDVLTILNGLRAAAGPLVPGGRARAASR